MIHKFEGQYTKCDCCNERIEEHNAFYNTGRKYDNTGIKVNEMDICNLCCTMVLEKLFRKNILSDDQIKECFHGSLDEYTHHVMETMEILKNSELKTFNILRPLKKAQHGK